MAKARQAIGVYKGRVCVYSKAEAPSRPPLRPWERAFPKARTSPRHPGWQKSALQGRHREGAGQAPTGAGRKEWRKERRKDKDNGNDKKPKENPFERTCCRQPLRTRL